MISRTGDRMVMARLVGDPRRGAASHALADLNAGRTPHLRPTGPVDAPTPIFDGLTLEFAAIEPARPGGLVLIDARQCAGCGHAGWQHPSGLCHGHNMSGGANGIMQRCSCTGFEATS